MAHTFLLESGKWMLEGNLIERDGTIIQVEGKILVTWNRTDWFNMVTKLRFPNADRPEIIMQYRGHLDSDERKYTFVVQHNIMGRVEGEGWIGPQSIVQRYWVLSDDKQRRTGFETQRQINDDVYLMTGAVMAGPSMVSAMESTLQRLPD